MNKSKPLLPTLRSKKRYLVFEVISDKKIIKERIFSIIMKSCADLLGLFDLGKANIRLLFNRYDPKNMRGIMCIDNNFVDKVKLSLGLITTIDEQDVIVQCVGVSGILKKAVNKYMG